MGVNGIVLGYGFTSPPQTLLKTQQPLIQIISSDGSVLKKDAPMETPDTIFLQGVLKNSIPLSMQFRVGAPFPGTPGLDWRIKGSEGEIRITGSGPFIQIGYPDLKLEVESGGEVEVFESRQLWEEDGIDGIPFGNVSRVYRELSEGKVNCTFEEAVEFHRVLEEAWKANRYEV
jgi:predicted dehydrogenase